jgi:hypothetical protein
MIRHAPAPWLKEGERERWLKVRDFSKLVMRSPKTVYMWLNDGETLAEFGYRAFQDVTGHWRIQVRPGDLTHLK